MNSNPRNNNDLVRAFKLKTSVLEIARLRNLRTPLTYQLLKAFKLYLEVVTKINP